jgi:hypothetical protein
MIYNIHDKNIEILTSPKENKLLNAKHLKILNKNKNSNTML